MVLIREDEEAAVWRRCEGAQALVHRGVAMPYLHTCIFILVIALTNTKPALQHMVCTLRSMHEGHRFCQ